MCEYVWYTMHIHMHTCMHVYVYTCINLRVWVEGRVWSVHRRPASEDKRASWKVATPS